MRKDRTSGLSTSRRRSRGRAVARTIGLSLLLLLGASACTDPTPDTAGADADSVLDTAPPDTTTPDTTTPDTTISDVTTLDTSITAADSAQITSDTPTDDTLIDIADTAALIDSVGADAPDGVDAPDATSPDASSDGGVDASPDSSSADAATTADITSDAGPTWGGACTTAPAYPTTPTPKLKNAPFPTPPPVPCGMTPGWPGGPAKDELKFTVATKQFGLDKVPWISSCLLMRDFNGDGKQDLLVVAVPFGPGANPQILQYTRTATGWSVSKNPVSTVTLITGCLAVDLDQDDDQDVVLVGSDGWRVLRNVNGVLTQSNAVFPSSVTGNKMTWSLAALDWDRDGFVDFIGGPHLQPSGGNTSQLVLACANKPAPYTICPPVGNFGKGVNLRILHGNGQLLFTDVTPTWKQITGDLLTLTPHDFDRDGWPDVFLGHDFGEHGWLRNLGDGTASWLTTQLGMRPYAHAMGAAVIDMDGDGLQDVVMSDFGVDTFYKRKKDGTYTIDSKKLGLWKHTMTTVSWGQLPFDFNQDGYPDLVTAISTNATPATFWGNAQKLAPLANSGHLAYRNVGGGKMVSSWLPYSLPQQSSIEPVGIVAGDLDGDGDLDLVSTRLPGSLIVFRNDTPNIGKALHVRVVGVMSTTDGLGAWVRIKKGTYMQERYVRAMEGYGAQGPRGVYFGVGSVTTLDELTVWWPSGRLSVLKNVKTGGTVTVTEPNK